jgi:hypothetical protein
MVDAAGRSNTNPVDTLYTKSEIGFFDFYVIPLAEKASESDRREWELKGQEVVEMMINMNIL